MTERTPNTAKIIEFPGIRVGEIELAVPGLNSELIGKDGQVLRESNLTDPTIQASIENTLKDSKYQGFVNGILTGEKVAFATFKKHRILTLVVISGTAAAAAVAIELGSRHGKDVREVINLFKSKDLLARPAEEPKP